MKKLNLVREIINKTRKRIIHFLKKNKTKNCHKITKNSLKISYQEKGLERLNEQRIVSNKKHTETLIEQTRSRPHETLEFEMKKSGNVFI